MERNILFLINHETFLKSNCNGLSETLAEALYEALSKTSLLRYKWALSPA